MLFSSQVVSLFLVETTKAHEIAVYGMPYFAAGFNFFALNMVLIGYYQSIENSGSATFFTVLRGFVLMIACFIVLPILLGTKGIWTAVPLAELLAFLAILLFYVGTRKNHLTTTVPRLDGEQIS
jgi:Na+-driven multidrug efflux pump